MSQHQDSPTSTADTRQRRAVVTGASRGLGRALARGLAHHGWTLVLTARGADDLHAVADELADVTTVATVIGDVGDATHRHELARTVARLGPVDLLVNNASSLGPSPLPRLQDLAAEQLLDVLRVNTVAPLAVFQALVDHLTTDATILNITSDAAVGAWEGWGGYGTSKAALDHLSAILAVEHPELHVHAVDPGDLRTAMHQAAFPGEDIGDRPLPETVVGPLLELVDRSVASGRHRVADLRSQVEVTA